MQEASWRGFVFSVTDVRRQEGRKTAVHSYPFSDTTYIEDLGEAPVEVQVEGFISGDTVYEASRAFSEIARGQGGLGVLVHPTHGAIDAILLHATSSESKSRIGAVDINLTFLAGNVTDQPVDASFLDTAGLLRGLLGEAGDAIGTDFIDSVSDAYKQGVSLARGVTQTAQQVQQVAGTIVRDATGAINATKGLSTLLTGAERVSRYNRSSSGGRPDVLTTINSSLSTTARVQTGVTTMLASATRARTTVTGLAASITSIGGTFR